MQAHWNTLINPYGASFPPLRRGWWAVCLKCFVASLKGSDTTVAPAEIARELKRCVNQSFASIEDGCWGREKERGEGERRGVKKDERLISFADLKNCYIFYVSIENCSLDMIWELSIVKMRNWMFRISVLIYPTWT